MNYTVTTNFASKDNLISGNPLKLIKGADFTVEFNNIVTAIASKFDSAATAPFTITIPALVPATNVPSGSVGLGAIFTLTTRSGGAGQYGNVLHEYLVTAALPGGQFDTGLTSWATATNLTGGQIFGSWLGANTPSTLETFTTSGSAAIGAEVNAGNRWGDFGLQSDVGGPRYTVGLQIVPDVVTSNDTFQTAVTMSSGTPGIVNWTAHNCIANTPITFSGAGTLPAALTAGTIYYVVAAGLTANSFAVSASLNGAAINFATSSTGALFGIASFPGSFGITTGASVHNHKWWVGHLVRSDTIMPGGHTNLVNGGSASNGAVPLDYLNLSGFWVNGIDLSAATFSGIALKAATLSASSAGGVVVSAATGGPALTVTGANFFNAAQFVGGATAGASFGPVINAGTTSADYAFSITDKGATQSYFKVFGDGGITAGTSPTGGDPGQGFVNVSGGLQINGSPVYSGIPQNLQSGASYTLVLGDASKGVNASFSGAKTFTIPANASVAFPVGTVVTFVNTNTGNLSIAITTDTLTFSTNNTTGTRTLATGGKATALKVSTTAWLIDGAGLT